MNETTIPTNGIYLIYADGHHEFFTGENYPEDTKYVGLIHDGHAFAIALKDMGEYQLLRDNAKGRSPYCCQRECDALNDWEYIERTKDIQKRGTDIPLQEGEYLPSLPMLVAMCYWAERGLNKALEYAGGNPLDMDSYYWSVTEYNSTLAWLVYFGSGYVGTYNIGKYYGTVARAVTAFPLHA